jgi:hypothetical protein
MPHRSLYSPTRELLILLFYAGKVDPGSYTVHRFQFFGIVVAKKICIVRYHWAHTFAVCVQVTVVVREQIHLVPDFWQDMLLSLILNSVDSHLVTIVTDPPGTDKGLERAGGDIPFRMSKRRHPHTPYQYKKNSSETFHSNLT